MLDFVGRVVLFQATSNARSAGFVQVNEDKFFIVRQDHVGFEEKATAKCDD